MHTKELLLLILICCVVTKNDADEEAKPYDYENIPQLIGEEGDDDGQKSNYLCCKNQKTS